MNERECIILLAEDDENDVLLVQRAFQKSNIANPHHVERIGDIALLKRALNQQHIILIILRQQDDTLPLIHRYPFFSSIQNRLPWPSTESSPARPPSRSTPFCTMARPM